MRYRRTLPWLAVACVAAACTGTSSTSPATDPLPASLAVGTSAAAEAQNKALVLRLYTEGFNEDKTGVVTELVGTDYIQHDRSLPGGADGQAKSFRDLKARIPGAVATVKRAAADGDLVALHWHVSATPANEATGEARADLYRVRDGKLVEHWGITQTVPAKTASGNSLFSDVYQPADGTSAPSEEQEETNRKFAVSAYQRLSDGDATVIDSWDPRYYQHNPLFPNGSAPLRMFLQQQGAPGSVAPTVNGGTRFGNTLADADLVWVFSSDYVVADIFRVADQKIIEHWDVAGGQ